MYLLNTLTDISFYRLGLIFKSLVKVLCIFIPLLIGILCSIDIFKIIFKPDEANTQIKTAVDRIIAGLIIFIIPSIINYSMSLINGYEKDTLFKYYEGASKEKIEELQIRYEKEQIAEANKKEAEYKEAGRRIAIEEEKERRQKEEIFNEWQKENNNNNSDNTQAGTVTYTGDTTSSGTYGKVTVSNGVFTIPNKRATSDADIPKQSGSYGLNPIFSERLNKFIEAGKQAGYTIKITSGWRSYSSQKRLWDNSTRACNIRNKWTACPGGSRHGFGIAADLKFNGNSCSKGTWNCNAAAKWAHDNAAKFGLTFRMSWEPWHIEPAQVKGGSFGSCNVSC